MVEQQLIDYIKKARDAGQTDDQTRNLLYKNGWVEAEVNDAVTELDKPQAQPQPQPVEQPQVVIQPVEQPQVVIQPVEQPQTVIQPVEQPQVVVITQPQPQIVRQPEPQYQPQSTLVNISQRRGGSNLFSKLLIVLIIVIVLGGVAYFTAGQYLNLPYSNFLFNFNLFKQEDPQTVINNMMANMRNVKSSQTTMRMEIGAVNKDTNTSIGKLILNTNTGTDIIDANNPKASGNFTINLTMPGVTSPITATVSVAAINKVSYLKLSEITTPDSYLLPADISQIQGKWLKIDQDSIKALEALSQANGGQTELPDISQIINSDLYNTELSKKIQDLLTTENLLSVSKQLGDETISGQSTYHYSIIINKDKLADLLNKLIILGMQETAALQNNTAGAASNPALVENMAQAVVKTFTDSLGDINMEMWIGKKDYMLYQVKLDKTIDLGKILESFAGTITSEPGSNNIQLELKFNMTNSNFNNPITVQVPADAQKIEEVLLPLPLTKEQNIGNNLKEIGRLATLILFPGKGYSSLCARGLLNGYQGAFGVDLIRLNNEIISKGGQKPSCFANTSNYCVSTQIAENSWLCIGKNEIGEDDKVGTTKCVSAQTVCQ